MKNAFWGASLAALAVVVAAGQAHASGFQLREQSATYMGTATAGATASATDLGTIFFNPAGMTYLGGTQAGGSLTYIRPMTQFRDDGSNVPGTDGGDAGEDALLPAVYALYSVDERLKLGLGVNTPFGLATDYDSGWIGRYHALRSELMTINVQPTVAYRLNQAVSLGAGFNLQYVQAELSQAVDQRVVGAPDGRTRLEGDDFGYGYNIGVILEPAAGTRIGANYRSRISHELEGDVKFEGLTPAFQAVAAGAGLGALFQDTAATADFTTPDILSIGVHHDLTDRLSLKGEVAWTNWSLFDELRVRKANGAADTVTPENWEDTWFFAVGATWKPTAQWSLDVGVAFDQTPVPDEFRTARVPDEDRTWLALGASYALSESASLSASYTHIFIDEAAISETVTTFSGAQNLVGSYDSHVDIVSISGSIKF